MDTAKELLVVEDAPEVLQMLEQILRLSGYEVMTARDGREALEAVQKRQPQLIVTDILMPRMDGFGLFYRLRVNAKTRDIPVIFLTATFISSEDRDFATTIGATRFVQKPIDTRDFLEMVRELLSLPPGERSAAPAEDAFLEKYRARLEARLAQTKSEIDRTRQMLSAKAPGERPTFETGLRQSLQDQEMMEGELQQLHEYLERRKQT